MRWRLLHREEVEDANAQFMKEEGQFLFEVGEGPTGWDDGEVLFFEFGRRLRLICALCLTEVSVGAELPGEGAVDHVSAAPFQWVDRDGSVVARGPPDLFTDVQVRLEFVVPGLEGDQLDFERIR